MTYAALRHLIILFLCCAVLPLRAATPSPGDLHTALQCLVDSARADVGVSVIDAQGNEVVSLNSRKAFPLMSVFKYPAALALLDKMQRDAISPDSAVTVRDSDLLPGTYSPLRDRYGHAGFDITLRELLHYSLSLSDNNACDILLRQAGGVGVVQRYLCRHGFPHIHITADEAQMHRDGDVMANRATPYDVARLFRESLTGNWLTPAHRQLVSALLEATQTGADKLLGQLPDGITVGHKTGSSDRAADGMKYADNDAGYVVLPDGSCYYVAIFVANSYESDAGNAALIAALSARIFACMHARHSAR